MSKARTLANFVSAGNPLSDGTIAASDISGLGTGVATALAVNVGSAGAPVVNGGALGTPSGGTLTSATGLPLSTGVTGTLPIANGGTGTTSTTFVNAATNVTGTLPVANGGTGQTALSAVTVGTSTNIAGGSNGTIPYQSAEGTTQMLATGTAGKVLTSNGVAAPSWETAASSSYRNVLGTSSNITLTTADGGGFITVSSTQNVNITLPAANTLTSKTIVLKNVGSFAMLVYDFDGNYLFPLLPDYGVTCWASVATTAAGTWTLGELPPDFVSPQVDIASTLVAGGFSKQSTTPYSSTQLLITFSIGTDMYATFATNSSGVLTFSTPQLFASGASNPAVMALSSTLAIINYADSSQKLFVVAASISGTTLTVGTPEQIAANAIYGNQWFAMLTATRATITWHQSGSQINTRLIDISGTTITLGNTVTVTNSAGTQQAYTCGMSSTLYAVTWYDSGNGNKIAQCQNNSGNTITVQSASSVFSNGDNGREAPIVCRSSSAVVVIYPDATTGYLTGRVMTTTGNLFNFNQAYTINTAGNLFKYEICAAGSDSFVVAYTDNLPQPLRLRGITTSGTSSMTIGSQTISSATGVNQTWYTPWNLQPFQAPSVTPSSSSFVSLYVPQSGFYQQAIGVSGTTLTTYTAYPVYPSTGLTAASNTNVSVAAFSSTRAAVFGVEPGDNGFSTLTAYLVDYSTTTPTYLSKLAIGVSSSTVHMCVTPLTSTTIVVIYRSSTNTTVANVITMSGTTLSAGAQATVNSATTCEYNSVSALSSSTLIAYYKKSSSVSAANVLTVSGTSISVGAETTVVAADVSYQSVVGLSSTSALATNSGNQVRILTISGTSVSAVSSQQSTGLSIATFASLSALSATQVMCVGAEGSGATTQVQATLLTISGTTVTPNPVASTTQIGRGSNSANLVMFDALRGIVFIPDNEMSLSFTVSNNIILFGDIQASACIGGAGALGSFTVATSNYQKAVTFGDNTRNTTAISRQVFSLGAAN